MNPFPDALSNVEAMSSVESDLDQDLERLCDPAPEDGECQFLLPPPQPLARLSAVDWALLVMPS